MCVEVDWCIFLPFFAARLMEVTPLGTTFPAPSAPLEPETERSGQTHPFANRCFFFFFFYFVEKI